MAHSIIAVVGARSGSKSVPHKNLKLLMGKPLMAWIIESAKKSRYIKRLILSTDSQDYADAGRQMGAEVPFLRPKEISGDLSTDFEYIQHTLNFLKKTEGAVPDIVCRLLPTTPLTRPRDIDATIEALIKTPEADSAQLVTEIAQTPYKSYRLGEDPRFLVPLITSGIGSSSAPVPRQMFPKVFVRANMIATRSAVVFEKKSLFGDKMAFHEVPQKFGIDIDSEIDFQLAELHLRDLAAS